MLIVVAASDDQWKELTGTRTDVAWQRVDKAAEFYQHTNADAFFSLQEPVILQHLKSLKKPVFINAVESTITELNTPANVYRINAWPSFLNRQVWEIAGKVDESVKVLFSALNIKINHVQDEPGFIAARIIAMIINEAYFAIEEAVSSKDEINTAMKLGTNYPYGPFEWAALIGINNVLSLLQKLNQTDSRYQPAALMIKEVTENKK